MGRADVRAAIADYLNAANITYLGAAFPHPPKFTSEAEFYQASAPGTAAGAAVFVHLHQQSERRIALGGPTSGQKMRNYAVTLICFFRSKKPRAEDADADNDTFLDSLTAAIQGDRSAGAGGVVFQWGEGSETYGVDIKITTELPRSLRQQALQIFSTLDVVVQEVLTT